MEELDDSSEGGSETNGDQEEEAVLDAIEVAMKSERIVLDSGSIFGPVIPAKNVLPAYAAARAAASNAIGDTIPYMINAFPNKADAGTTSLASKKAIAATAPQSQSFFETLKDRLSSARPETDEEHIEGQRKYNIVCARTPAKGSTKGMDPGVFSPMDPKQQEEFDFIARTSLHWVYRYALTVCHGHFLTIFRCVIFASFCML